MRYPWQHDDWQRLATAFSRLPNAWLFTGPAGIGKSEFAHQVAQALLCEAPGADHRACGQCQACHWFAAGNHPDYRLLAPASDDEDDEAKAGKRKLPVIKIDGVRAVIEFAHLSSHRGGQSAAQQHDGQRRVYQRAEREHRVVAEPTADQRLHREQQHRQHNDGQDHRAHRRNSPRIDVRCHRRHHWHW